MYLSPFDLETRRTTPDFFVSSASLSMAEATKSSVASSSSEQAVFTRNRLSFFWKQTRAEFKLLALSNQGVRDCHAVWNLKTPKSVQTKGLNVRGLSGVTEEFKHCLSNLHNKVAKPNKSTAV